MTAVVLTPQATPLQQIVTYCEENNVVSVAIDAQLTIALSENNGFRTSDLQLRGLLPADCRNWVASVNSLMAVPVRGKLLADFLSPIVGTLLETHPRASLMFGLDQSVGVAVRNYKKGTSVQTQIATLWEQWSNRFRIAYQERPKSDGAIDALVCATIAYLYHRAPETLLKLKNEAPDKTGRGPFYVVAPILASEASDS